MDSKNWIGVGIVVVVLVVGAYLVGQSSNNKSPVVTTPTPINNTTTESATNPYPTVQTPTPQPSYTAPSYYTPMTFSTAVEAQRSSYVNGCTSSGGMWGKCNCAFDYLISNYGLVWLINENAYVNVNGVASTELRSASLDAYKYCSVYSN